MINFRTSIASLLIVAAACAPTMSAAETHIVEINGFSFSPSVLDVAVGDTVTWINNDVVPHTATAGDGSWDSGSLDQGEEWSLVVENAGSADYICTFHPQMTGTINAR